MADDLLTVDNATWTVVSNAGGTGTGTLGEAINNAASGDNIIFDLGTSNTVTTTGSTIAKSLNIDGSNLSGDNVTISGARKNRLYKVTSDSTVEFSGMTLYRGLLSGDTAAAGVTNDGIVDFTDVTFAGNTMVMATAGKDGSSALRNTGTATMTNVTLSRNTVKSSVNGDLSTVYSSGTLSVDGGTFFKNIVLGGTVAVGGVYNAAGTATIADAVFSGNTASDGTISAVGGVYNAGSMTLSGSTFTSNWVSIGGTASAAGGVYNSGTLTATDVSFSGNTFYFSRSGTTRFAQNVGSAIYNAGSATLSNVTLSGNYAYHRCSRGDDATIATVFNAGTLTLCDVTFSGNSTYSQSASTAGAIANLGGTVIIAGSVTLATSQDTFVSTGVVNWDLSDAATRNNVTLDGYQYLTNSSGSLKITVGADDMTGSYTIAENVGSSTATSFTLTGLGADQAITVGGDMVSYGDYLCRLEQLGDNYVLMVGTEIETPSLTVTTLDDVVNPLDGVISLREAIAYAAANADLKGADGKFTITFADSVYTDNQAWITIDSQLELAANQFSASYGELVIQGTSGKTLMIDGKQSTRLLRINSGNVVSLQNLTMQNGLVVTSGTAGRFSGMFGGAVLADHSTLNVDNCRFVGNKCYDSAATVGCGGGALYSCESILTVTCSEFIGNSVSGRTSSSYGGAIATSGGTAVIKGSLMQENTSISSGGAITVTYDSDNNGTDLTLYECILLDNKITGNTFGGSLCVHGGTSKVINSTIYQGQSASGGALYVDLNGGSIAARCFVVNSTMTANTASSGQGNGIYLTESTSQLNLLNSIVVGNDAYKASGGIITNVNNLYDDSTDSAIRSGNVTTTPADTFAAVDGGTAYYQADGTCHALEAGPADQTGYYVWASDDFQNIAYASTIDGDKTALVGDASLATNMISVITDGGTAPNIGNGITQAKIDPETPSLNVTTAADGVNKFDGLITFREALLYAAANPELKADDKFTVTFDDALYAAGSDVHYLGGTIAIGSNVFTESAGALVIQGPADTSRTTAIDGEMLFQILDIASGNVVTISNVTLQSGKAVNGGALKNAGALTLDDVVFNQNAATTSGGALYNTGKVTLTGDVTLTTSTDTFVNSGTVNWDLTKATAAHSVTLGNYQYFTNTGSLYLTIDDTVKAGDSYIIATGVGSSTSGKNSFTLTGLGDTASISIGGAVDYGNLTYKLAQKSDKLVLSAAGYSLVLDPESVMVDVGQSVTVAATLSDGGSGTLEMTKVTFSSSTIADLSYELTSSGATITVNGTALGSDTITVTATGVNGKSYTAEFTLDVGKFYALTGEANIQPMYTTSGVTFKVNGNTVTRAQAGDIVTLVGKSVDHFGVVGFTDGAGAVIEGNTITMPEQDVSVKAHYRFNVLEDNTLGLVTGTYTNELGYDGNGGMGIVQSGGAFSSTDASFAGNTATGSGGAVQNYGVASFTGGTFGGNAAKLGGVIDNMGILSVDGVLFAGNAAGGAGGAIRITAGTATITASGFDGNTSTSSGGAVFTSEEISISGSTFTNNTAAVSGGALDLGNGTISTSVFERNFATTSGGAVFVGGGSVVVADTTFTGNVTGNTGGGAIYVDGGSVAITSSTFSGNTATSSGGAIRINTGNGSISSSVFDQNYSTSAGGAVLSATPVSFDGCTFTGNTATGRGGAINVANGTVSSSVFVGNVSLSDGGAVYSTSKVVISGSTFSGNTGYSGAAVYSNAGNVSISGSTFTGNTTSGAGGAMRIKAGNGTITSSVFDHNASTGSDGGAIYSGGKVSISGSTFTGNTSSRYGGAFYNGSTLTLNDVTFSGNAAKTLGGAFYNGGTVNMTGNVTLATASDSIAWNLAGGTASYAVVNGYSYLQNSGNATLSLAVINEQAIGSYTIATGAEDTLADSKSVFTLAGIGKTTQTITVGDSNVAYGTRFYSLVKEGSDLVLTVDIPRDLSSGANIQPMYAASGVTFMVGGVTVNQAKAGDTVTLVGNTVDQFEIAGYINNAGLTIAGNSFTMPDQNVTVEAQYHFNVQTGNTLNLAAGTYTNKLFISGNGGMGEVRSGGVLNAIGTSENQIAFAGNTATYGGAIQCTSGTASFAYTTFSGNTAAHGGALHAYAAQMSVTNSIFADNMAAGTGNSGGGAIYNYGGNISISGSTFTRNRVVAQGGVVWSASGTVTATDSTFSDNVASYGGVIFNYYGSLSVDGGTLAKNTVTNYGGAIFSTNGTSVLTDVEISGNTAIGAAGAIYSNGGNLSISGGTISQNVAGQSGAVYAALSTTTLSDVTFSGNTALGNGGAVFVASNATTVTDVIFSGNTALGDGGALFVAGNTATVTGATFSNNTSLGNGGAVFVANVAGNTMVLSGVTFVGNTATTLGGALYNDNGTVVLAGTVTLATASDTLVNNASLVWDLSQSDAMLNGYQYVTNNGTMSLKVDSNVQAGNSFTIATDVSGTCTDSFTLTGLTGTQAITVGGDEVKYNDLYYQLTQVDDTLVLSVTQEVYSLVLDPASVTVVAGSTTQFSATLTGDHGSMMTISDLSFSTTDLATFNYTGTTSKTITVTGVKSGSGTVKVTATGTDSKSYVADLALTVNPGEFKLTGASSLGMQGGVNFTVGGVAATTAHINDVVTVSAVEVTGYTFAGFTSGDVTIVDNQFAMPAKDVTVQANYTAIDYNLVGATSVAGGGVNFTVGGTSATTAHINDVVTVSAVEVAGYTFTGFTSNDVTIIDNQFTMPAKAVTVQANYEVSAGAFYCSTWSNGQAIDVTWHNVHYSGTVGDGTFFNNYSGAKTKVASTSDPIVVLESSTLTSVQHYDAQNVYLSGVDAVYNRMILGGELISGDNSYTGSYTVNIEGGTYMREVAGGDASNKYVDRTGNITLNISGGVFVGHVLGGSYYSVKSAVGNATVVGDINLTISGGVFERRVYGGCGSFTEETSSRAAMDGNVYLTIDASTNAIDFQECVAAGNRGYGLLLGSTNVTVTGLGSNLTFADESVLFGGCGGDYYNTDSGVRTAVTSVIDPVTWKKAGVRALTFDNFTGDFNAEIRMFSDITFGDGTLMNFADANLDLKEIENWNFDCTSFASNLTKNRFAGDAINVDTSALTEGSWTLLSGSESAFADLGSAASVTLGGATATYSGTAWMTDNFSLSVEDQTKLVISKIA